MSQRAWKNFKLFFDTPLYEHMQRYFLQIFFFYVLDHFEYPGTKISTFFHANKVSCMRKQKSENN